MTMEIRNLVYIGSFLLAKDSITHPLRRIKRFRMPTSRVLRSEVNLRARGLRNYNQVTAPRDGTHNDTALRKRD